MSDSGRRATMEREKGRGLVRALHLSELQSARAARELALKDAEQQLERIAKVLPDALGAGISLSEVARVTGLSRPTLYQLKARYSDDGRDLTLAVFQTIASYPRGSESFLADWLGHPKSRIHDVVRALLEKGLVAEDFNDDPEDPGMAYWLTEAGFGALEQYSFAGDDRVTEG